jgi:small subunit ribosomal protein S20
MPAGTPVKHKKKSKSVLKNIRQSAARQIHNRANRTRVRSVVKKIRAALNAKDLAAAEKMVGTTFSELDRAVRKRILHWKTANRYKSRLTLAVNALRAAPKKA